MNVPFRTKRMLNFGDCDISGTAYYPAYLNILNNVNEEFWEHLGWTWYQIMIKERWGTPTVHLSCDFSVPSYFGQELDFEVRVLKVGRSSLTLHHTVSYTGKLVGRANRCWPLAISTSTIRSPGPTMCVLRSKPASLTCPKGPAQTIRLLQNPDPDPGVG